MRCGVMRVALTIVIWLNEVRVIKNSKDSSEGRGSGCLHRGQSHSCTFTFACWLSGGESQTGCSSSYFPFSSWLFACCVHHSYQSLPTNDNHNHHSLQKRKDSIPKKRVLDGCGTRNVISNLWYKCDTLLLASSPVKLQTLTDREESMSPVWTVERYNHKHGQNSIQIWIKPQSHDGYRAISRAGVNCGTPVMGFQKRIIGGSEAFFGELPWQAHLRIAGYQCGGVLVSKQFVLTAAHCVHRAVLKDIMVYLGEYDTQNTGYFMEPLPEEILRVIQKIVHPKFQFRMSQPDRFDVALIRLNRGVSFRENILPICLPKRGMAFSGRMGLVAGWGKTDTSYGKTGTNILRKAFVPILSDEECLEWHRHKNIRVELHKEMFCAGHSDGHMDACLGDSGGPLIVLDGGHWTLAGITSAGFGCAVDHQPGIYHKVQMTTDWIMSVIQQPP